jgi:hypothetical protein
MDGRTSMDSRKTHLPDHTDLLQESALCYSRYTGLTYKQAARYTGRSALACRLHWFRMKRGKGTIMMRPDALYARLGLLARGELH